MDRINYFLRIKKLQKQQDKIWNDFQKKKKENKGKDIHGISAKYIAENDLIYDEILELQTKYLLGKAAKLLIPLPDHESYWIKSKITGINYLSLQGIQEMKKLIREEYKPVLTWIASLTGLLGAAIGLISALTVFYK